ncbi:carboxy terminal-processing peptidase [Alienimonas californiensis]|uniref:Tail-specific protease n=1 Tax=Alienimonas californiensis TaxID=2527989 RepID=A0A517PFA8_9PLAN|nr:carboxy terminal-processing peptidase [Alienimonas californiensis]QDT18060.1 Tail-specific protease precursor [Alienimonas californiensis]
MIEPRPAPSSHVPSPKGAAPTGNPTTGGRAWRAVLIAASLTVTAGLAVPLFAQNEVGETTRADATTARMAAELLDRYHVSGKTIDNEASKRLFTRFFESLDPAKLYFEQSDLEAFRRYETQLDDAVRRGDLTFVNAVYDRYGERLEQRVAFAQRLIDSEFDFTQDESIVSDPDDITWAASPEEMNERWRKRIKYDVLQLRLEDEELKAIRERLHKRYSNLLSIQRQVEPADKLETFITALAMTFDPHSSFMSEKTLEDFQISMNLSLEGIGAALQNEDGYVTVKQIIQGGAAEEDGRLKLEDKIIGVAQGGEAEFTDVVEMRIGNVVRLIRGESGTVVRLQVMPAAGGEVKVIELKRRKIELKDSAVRGEIYNLQERLGLDQPLKVGVINIPSFYRDFAGANAGVEGFSSTSRDVLKALQAFRSAGGVDAVVVDLRYDGGGALTEAIEVTGLFIDEGPVVQVKDPAGKIEVHSDERPDVAYGGPLVVLTNRLSASASEIFAGAIKDYGRGIIVGDETTHGKGTVQNVMPVPPKQLFNLIGNASQGALKLTIQQFYRVNGDSTQNLGVRSDVVLPDLLDHMELGEQFLDNALEFDRIAAADFRPVAMASPAIAAKLQEASKERVAADPEFAKTLERIARYERDKNRKTVSLNEDVRRQERAELKALSDDEDGDEEEDLQPTPGEGPVLPESAYNDEVLRITADYVRMFRSNSTAQRANPNEPAIAVPGS